MNYSRFCEACRAFEINSLPMAGNRVCSFCEQSEISDESGDQNDMIPCSTCGDFCKFVLFARDNMCDCLHSINTLHSAGTH